MSRYRRTGRKPGRPRRAATPQGRIARASDALDLSTFPALTSAVERILADPGRVIHKGGSGGGSTVFYLTPRERSEILAATWWVYCNRDTWPRESLLAAVESLSPLMLFSSAFLTELVRIPRDTVTKHMVKPPGAPIARVMGSASPWLIHGLLITSRDSGWSYRNFLQLTLKSKEVPKSFLSRLSGVPESALLRPERGVEFFPERHDLMAGVVNQRKLSPRGPYDPDPGAQQTIRDAFAGEDVGSLLAVMAPYPDSGSTPVEVCIPGYRDDPGGWCSRYRLPGCSPRGERASARVPSSVLPEEEAESVRERSDHHADVDVDEGVGSVMHEDLLV